MNTNYTQPNQSGEWRPEAALNPMYRRSIILDAALYGINAAIPEAAPEAPAPEQKLAQVIPITGAVTVENPLVDERRQELETAYGLAA